MTHITTIAFDADDTLWENERFFHETEAACFKLLSDYGDHDDLAARLLETERRNIPLYGFGIKGFTLSMIETALAISDQNVSQSVLANILSTCREMLSHPVELLPHVRDTLETLKPDYRLLLITKGDLHHQERKINASGLDHYFEAVEIVSDKDVSTYRYAFETHGDGPAQGVMVGNSMKSDVLPMIDAGGYGVFIPHTLDWAYERAEAPQDQSRFAELKSLKDLHAHLNGWHNQGV